MFVIGVTGGTGSGKTSVINMLKEKTKKVPTLSVILIGNYGPSEIYVKNKEKKAAEVGIESVVISLNKDIDEKKLLEVIESLNKDDKVDGILVQLPLPNHIDSNKVIDKINPNKDVEYNYDDNIINLMIEDPFITMERKSEDFGKIDLSVLYQKGLKFQGPRPKVETIKLKTIKGRIRIDMNIKKSMIYFEPGIVRVAIDLDYK